MSFRGRGGSFRGRGGRGAYFFSVYFSVVNQDTFEKLVYLPL